MKQRSEHDALHVENLTLILQTQHGIAKAISNLNFCIQKGQTFALVGESGCGKSMTALTLMRLLPQIAKIQSGEVCLGGENAFRLSEREMQNLRGKRISIIFQEPSTSLNPVMSIGDQLLEVILPLMDAHSSSQRDKHFKARLKAIEWLNRVGIPDPEKRLHQFPFEFSGGQLQRIMIAIALAGEPDVLIADEPTTALDVRLQAQILELLKSLQKERHMALLLITHDLGVVKGMADRVALMYSGEIVEVADAVSFFRHPTHPYAQMLLKALPSLKSRGRALQAIDGQVLPLTDDRVGCRFIQRCPFAHDACQEQQVQLNEVNHTSGHLVRCVRLNDDEMGWDAQAPRIEVIVSDDKNTSHEKSDFLLKVEDLSVSYPLKRSLWGKGEFFDAVKAVSFSIEKGKTLALVGESGCGKSTLGKALVQVLPDNVVTTGKVLFNGDIVFDVANERAVQRQVSEKITRISRSDIQIIFQNPYASLNPRMRIQEILEEGMLSLHPEWSAEQRMNDLQALMIRVGLSTQALSLYPHEFSGGQRQRIAIARALAVKPSLIICDEPTSALDVSIQAQILNLLQELKDDLGMSYLFITHNLGVVSHLADEVAVMHEGQIIEWSKTEPLLENPQKDFTKTLLQAVPSI